MRKTQSQGSGTLKQVSRNQTKGSLHESRSRKRHYKKDTRRSSSSSRSVSNSSKYDSFSSRSSSRDSKDSYTSRSSRSSSKSSYTHFSDDSSGKETPKNRKALLEILGEVKKTEEKAPPIATELAEVYIATLKLGLEKEFKKKNF